MDCSLFFGVYRKVRNTSENTDLEHLNLLCNAIVLTMLPSYICVER